MIEYIQRNFLSNNIIDIRIILLLVILCKIPLSLLILQLDKNPGIFLILFLDETAIIKEDHHLFRAF